ncbi:membrane protein [Streptomyces ruber]|uniref:Membrane protein n=2 Tax=Streptomyces TaxID=1883 RepID=A0A918BSP1_9ACTN|nr:DUF308 domain-containing protein [Streptomyces ruber]GGQ87950.1 membrane protein [Streptomyces ruber]
MPLHLFATASDLGPIAVTLLVPNPLSDVAAAVTDARTSRAGGRVPGLYANIVISSLAAVALAYAASSGVPAALRVWGAWAIASGLVQLVVGVGRRKLGGQWAMIVSGALSVLAGTSFCLQASTDGASLTGLAGYATLGGVFFLVSALRLGRTARKN